MNVVLFGSTGLIGKNVLKLLVRLDQVERVYCPVRSVPALSEYGILNGAAKVDFEVVDFDHVDKLREKFEGLDAAICCLGTTIKQAGSKPAQEKIDVRLPLSLAAVAKKAGVRHFLCVSAHH